MVPHPEEESSIWQPLVNTLATNEKLRIVRYSYRHLRDLRIMGEDTLTVYDYLKAQGANKIIAVCSGYGAHPCLSDLSKEPEIIGMVLISMDGGPLMTGFPKLFLTADKAGDGGAGITKSAYDHSDEPKTFKSYPSDMYGAMLFYTPNNPNVSSQALADIADFIDGIVNGQ